MVKVRVEFQLQGSSCRKAWNHVRGRKSSGGLVGLAPQGSAGGAAGGAAGAGGVDGLGGLVVYLQAAWQPKLLC